MSENLIETVLERACADPDLSEESKLLVLAALEGDGDLADALQDQGHIPVSVVAAGERPPPVHAFLSSVTVEGFRGIGPRSTLHLTPGPGLVVVAGRNGCGKSSFAEGLEVALTQNSYRWRTRSAVWQQSWRNLHHSTPTAITVELAEKGAGLTTVAATWATDAELGAATPWVQRSGAKREAGLEVLGWSTALDLHRPFLSYDELGALFAEPSKLYVALASILGLERLEDAQRRLTQTQKSLAEPKETAARLAKELRLALPQIEDQRAAATSALLRKTRPDLAAVRDLIAGSASQQTGDLARLRTLAELPARAPDPVAFGHALTRHTEAVAKLAALDAGLGAANARKSELLAGALAVHAEQGDGPCPVCGQGVLDADWAARVAAELSLERETTQRRSAARQDLTAAEQGLRSLVGPASADLVGAGKWAQADAPELPSVAEMVAAWQRWTHLAQDVSALAREGAGALADLRAHTEAVAEVAEQELRRREDTWQPVAVRLAEWLGHAEVAQAQQEQLAQVKAALTWLKEHAHELRNDRIRPLADRARHIWAQLRQESNVDLGEITLAGTNTRRHVELTAAVDGVEAGALAVMSQGELHALALSLFLPKATTADSPFGFVVIDDPVQAMDPAKVDGLARVLGEVAADRQVIVFTHDDRLPEAVRRLNIPARLVEVTRDRNSRVAVTNTSDPAQRYLDDARAVASDQAVPEAVRRQVIPELCRMSLETRCRDLYFGHQLRAGADRAAVERAWAAATRTRAKVALAVHNDANAPLDGRLGGSPRHKAALGICSSAPHNGLNTDSHRAIDDVENFIIDLGNNRGR